MTKLRIKLLLAVGLWLANAHVLAASEGVCATASLINPNSIEGGVGGTGAPAKGGIGGTGSPAANGGVGGTGSPVATGGVGGTGDSVAKGGIGGTGDSVPAFALLPDDVSGSIGIMGVVTGFASICVNGEEVQYDASTPIYENGKVAKLADLAVGKTVMLKVDEVGGSLQARAIGLFNAITGPVSNLDIVRQEITVMGQTIQVNRNIVRQLALALAEDANSTISVSGYRSDMGNVVASRVDIVSTSVDANTLGLVTSLLPNGFVVNGTKVHLTNRQALGKVKVGSEVQVAGNWNNGTLQANQVHVQPINNIVNRVDAAIMEGYVRSDAQNNVSISGTEVTSAQSNVLASPPEEFKDKLVKVEMRRSANGKWVTDRITDKTSKRIEYQIQFKDENVLERAKSRESRSSSSGSSGSSDSDGKSTSGSSGRLDSSNSGSGSSGSGRSSSDSSGSGRSGSGSSGSGSSGSGSRVSGSTSGSSGSGSSGSSSSVKSTSGSSGSGSSGSSLKSTSGSSGSSGSGSSGSGSSGSGSSGSGKKK